MAVSEYKIYNLDCYHPSEDSSASTCPPACPVAAFISLAFCLRLIFLSRFFPRFYHHLTANQLDSLHYSLRKCAHLTEYAILGILTMRAVRRSRFASITRAAISRPVVLTSWAFCALYAATDEFHQIFVPGRTPEVTDALLDSLGAAIGIALYIAFARRQRARGAQ